MIATKDPTVFILENEPERKVYFNTYTNEKWEIIGVCNSCGACESKKDPDIIWTGIPVGEPGACYHKDGELRLDNPVRPEIKTYTPICVLNGRYLNGN